VTSAFTPAIDVLSTVATAIVAGYGGYLALQGAITVGVVVAFLTYVQQFFRPIQALSTFYTTAQASLAAAERIFDLVDTPPDLVDAPGAHAMPPIDGRVTFEHASFSYGERPLSVVSSQLQDVAGNGRPTTDRQTTDNRQQITDGRRDTQYAIRDTLDGQRTTDNGRRTTGYQLQDVSLVAEPGQTVAIVGPTGAGKTTLVNMIGRFYDVGEGLVMIDGVDVRDVTRASLRSQMGVVLQDSFLFSGTLAENIRYGRLDATDAEVEAAARAANAHDFIARLPEGYQTKIGERGGTLSQGQRQLIGIARAILADPRILILDEATSSVDTRTEALIQAALKTLLKGRTSFVIAHRLSTIREADQVLVMQEGQIVERGTHAELLELGAVYAELYRRQFRDEAGGQITQSAVDSTP
jgi:ATP-binding cassette, subfamily B, multidrug efflux pump